MNNLSLIFATGFTIGAFGYIAWVLYTAQNPIYMIYPSVERKIRKVLVRSYFRG